MKTRASNISYFSCIALIVLGAMLLFSCQTVPPKQDPQTQKKWEPKIALVLGGGSAKGFAHVGVIRVLEQEKIPGQVQANDAADDDEEDIGASFCFWTVCGRNNHDDSF